MRAPCGAGGNGYGQNQKLYGFRGAPPAGEYRHGPGRLSALERGGADAGKRLLRYLGYDVPDDEPMLFGTVRRLDERLLRALDIDTRSVGEIFRPQESQFQFLADDLYIDEWGNKAQIHRHVLGYRGKPAQERGLRRPGPLPLAGCGQHRPGADRGARPPRAGAEGGGEIRRLRGASGIRRV